MSQAHFAAYGEGMQQDPSQSYFERRAEQEQAAAARAIDARAAQSHRELADRYRRFATDSGGPTPNDAPIEFGTLPREFLIVP
jgi:hypothetical protein